MQQIWSSFGNLWYHMVLYGMYKLNTHAENMAILIFHHLVFSKNASAVDVIRLHADRKWNLIIHAGFPLAIESILSYIFFSLNFRGSKSKQCQTLVLSDALDVQSQSLKT